MSVQKLSDSSRSVIEQNPFAQICNEIIEHIKDNDAFRLYCYLYSKSREWRVIKEYAVKMCDVGERKAKQCWSYLARCGLIEYRVIKNEKNVIIKHELLVLNGTIFNKDEPFLKPNKEEKLSTNHRCNFPPSGESTRVENARLLNKDKTNKEKTKNKESVLPKLPSSISEELWESFKEHRRTIKKPMTKLAEKILINKLIVFNQSGYPIKEMLEESIVNGWSSVYEPKKMHFAYGNRQENKQNIQITSPKYRDWTQERLDREANDANLQ